MAAISFIARFNMSDIAADAQPTSTAAQPQASADTSTQTRQEKATASPAGTVEKTYEQELREFEANPDAYLGKTKAEADPEPEPAETPEPEAPEVPADAAPEPEVPETPAETPEEEASTTPETAAPATPKRKHVNLERLGPDKAKLVTYLDRNPDVSIEDAMVALGITKKAPESQAEPDPNAPPATIQATESKITALWAERDKALTEKLDFVEVARIDKEIDKLKDHKLDLREKAQTIQRQAEAQWDQTVAAAEARAVQFYPDAAKADSPLVKKAVEIDARLEETENPLFNDPEKAFKIMQMAANELGIAPRDPNAQKAPVKAVSPPVPAKTQAVKTPVQPGPAAGSARTVPTQSKEVDFSKRVDSIKDEEGYRKELEAFGVHA